MDDACGANVALPVKGVRAAVASRPPVGINAGRIAGAGVCASIVPLLFTDSENQHIHVKLSMMQDKDIHVVTLVR